MCAWSYPWCDSQSVGEDRLAERVREDVVEEEMEFADHADTVTGCARHRDHGFESDLPLVGLVDDAGLEVSGGQLTGRASIVDRGLEGEFGDRDQVLDEVVVDPGDL